MSQVFTNHNNVSDFIPAGDVVVTTGNTIDQDADHSGDVAEYTVIARTATGTLKNMEASDGSEFPVALLKGTIPEADIQGGDVTNVRLYTKGGEFDLDSLVLENSLTSATVIAFMGTAKITIKEALQIVGITFKDADTVAGYENS
jgi:hypothetical protein